MNQCLICGQIYNPVVTLMLMVQVTKEANIRRTLIISNRRKCYQPHVRTQGGSGGVTKLITRGFPIGKIVVSKIMSNYSIFF